MTLRTGLLNGNNITQDYDFGYMLQAIATGGYIEGLEVQTGKVVAGKGFVPCVRTNGNKPFVFVELSADFVVDTTGTKKIWIEIPQAKLDDGSLNNEDGTDIATISTGASYPAGNYIPLASITGGTITDERTKVTVKADAFIFSKSLRDLLDIYNFTTPTTKKFLVFDTGTNKWTTGTVDASDVPQANYLGDSQYFLGESCLAGEYLFLETTPTFALATGTWLIGNTAQNTRCGIIRYGTGISGNTTNLALAKVVSPSVNLNVRVEIDNNGLASGTLVHANATGTVAPGSLTTSIADTVVTFAGSFTIPLGQKVHIILFVGTYGSETINGTNYYKTSFFTNHTTIHNGKHYNGVVWEENQLKQYYDFTGTTIDTNVWLTTGTVSQNGYMVFTPAGSGFMVTNFRTVKDYTGDMDITSNLWSSYGNAANMYFYAYMILYFDANNYIRIYESSSQWNNISYVQVEVYQGGVSVYSSATGNLGNQGVLNYNVRIQYERETGKVRFYYGTAGAIIPTSQIGTEYVSSFTGASYKVAFSSMTTNGGSYSQQVRVDDVRIKNYIDGVSILACMPYANSTLFATKVLSKTNSDYAYKLDYVGASTLAYNSGEVPKIILPIDNTIDNIHSGMTENAIQYLSNTAGGKSETPGTYKVQTGVAITSTKMNIKKRLGGVPIPVTASPFTRQNTTGKALQYYVSGGTINPIAISKDGTTFISQSTATGYIGTIAPGDYLRVTYTVLPTITYSDL